MLYLSYGSNLNFTQMRERCPLAKPLKKIFLHDYSLVFRGFADIEKKKSKVCTVGIWKITLECEKKLDFYEQFPKLYTKVFFKLNEGKAMTYKMLKKKKEPPNQEYFEKIEQGYEDFNLDKKYLFEAKNEALKFWKIDKS